jgi:hypothetical protein
LRTVMAITEAIEDYDLAGAHLRWMSACGCEQG